AAYTFTDGEMALCARLGERPQTISELAVAPPGAARMPLGVVRALVYTLVVTDAAEPARARTRSGPVPLRAPVPPRDPNDLTSSPGSDLSPTLPAIRRPRRVVPPPAPAPAVAPPARAPMPPPVARPTTPPPPAVARPITPAPTPVAVPRVTPPARAVVPS